MKVAIFVGTKKYVVEVAQYSSTRAESFQRFLMQYKLAGYYQVSDSVAILYHSVARVELLDDDSVEASSG